MHMTDVDGQVQVTMTHEELGILRYALAQGVDKLSSSALFYKDIQFSGAAEAQDIADKAKFFPKIQLMLEMARLAFESDSTRIITLMVDGFATPVFEIDDQHRTRDGYHNLSHHGRSKEKLAELEKVDLQQMRHLRDLITALAATPTADSRRLLDHTMVLYGSNLGDANVHNCTNLPVLLAGGGFKHGQHLAFDTVQNKPLCNLFVSMMQNMGIESAAFGSSGGTLTGLNQL
jgi:hypothetical protein